MVKVRGSPATFDKREILAFSVTSPFSAGLSLPFALAFSHGSADNLGDYCGHKGFVCHASLVSLEPGHGARVNDVVRVDRKENTCGN